MAAAGDTTKRGVYAFIAGFAAAVAVELAIILIGDGLAYRRKLRAFAEWFDRHDIPPPVGRSVHS